MSAGTHRGDIAEQEVMAARRELVAKFRLRRLSFRAIAKALADIGCVNPRSGEPWNHKVVADDCAALLAEWKERARDEFDDRRACLLSELEEVRAAGWAADNFDVVLRAIKSERELLGLDAALNLKLSGSDGGPLQVQVYLPAKDADSD